MRPLPTRHAGVDVAPARSLAQPDRARRPPIEDLMRAGESVSAGLFGVVQRDGIVAPEPTPSFFRARPPRNGDGARAHIPPIARTTTPMTSDRTMAQTTTAAV